MRFWRREKLWIGFRFRNEQLSCLKLLNSIILLCLCSISWNVDFALSHIWYFVPPLFFLCAHFLKNTVPDCHFEKITVCPVVLLVFCTFGKIDVCTPGCLPASKLDGYHTSLFTMFGSLNPLSDIINYEWMRTKTIQISTRFVLMVIF